MYVKNLEKKLHAIASKSRKLRMKLGMTEKAATPLKGALSLEWGPKRGTFKATNLEFDPRTGEARSYQWYSISRVFKHTLVLNTYRYSVTTAKHVRKLRFLFDRLGLKYIEIEAPKGLQNIEAAVARHISLYAHAFVREKYARIKRPYSLKHALTQLNNCRRLGGIFTDSDVAKQIAFEEGARRAKLDRERDKVRVREGTESDRDRAGLHVILDRMPWNTSDLQAEAKAKGFRTVWVHVIPGVQVFKSRLTNDDMRDNEANVYHSQRSKS